jgi:predicted DNA-binding transcriptional regulator AlpA
MIHPTPPEALPRHERRPTLAAAGLEPLLSLDDLAAALSCSRRAVERLRSAAKLPPPDLRIGRMPRWKPATVRAWIDAQANGRGVAR